ncbi:flagellin N-terminal helical domain-containing protein [Leclercia sp. LSNIH1]|uniref:flagellin N-terminal helical domain-containing protein n=1 Tax=Leclercia sp. LSNIH1 TaxID=1920114 RepID=UPI000CD2FB84|nr:flagellin [Leclercia sp. LSNIH1]AUU86377.1 flagellin [Leclercia sp. LSNIH1]POV36672.1 flagellin [Leclercia sp. LSNIH5]POW68385.1 flagellin [Leclercia sp. LSNIH2]
MLSLKTNLMALTLRGQSAKNTSALEQSIRNLSSGMRINSAKDNAANQAIANRMTSQQNGLQQAQRNAGDGLSMIQTAEGAMDEINNRLQRIRELTVKGLSESNTLVDADTIQAEINLNLKEIDRLNGAVDFNGINLLNGSAGTVGFQVGTRDNEKISLDLSKNFSVESIGLKDFVIRGISGKVSDINQVSGNASNIDLNSGNVSVTWYPTGSYNSPQLVRNATDGRYYIQDTGADGKPAYYQATTAASWDTASGTGTVNISATNGTPLYSSVTQLSSRTITSVSYIDTNGGMLSNSPAPTLRESNGQYYIEQDDLYYPATLSYGSSGAVTAQMTSTTAKLDTDFATLPAVVTTTPNIDATTAALSFRDASNNPLSGSSSRLLKSGSQYIMEVDDGNGNFNYYTASVTTTTDGTNSSLVVTANNATSLNNFSDVNQVNGSSRVTMDPAKVNVRYTDAKGNISNDVLRLDADGNYYMDVVNGTETKKATLVLTDENPARFLLKTLNGLGDLQIYYQASFSASTDAATNYTTLNIDEVGDEIRLKNPENPLAALDNAIKQVDERRSTLGAVANRLESTQNLQATMSVAVSASRSRIEDADYAAEVSSMARAQMLQETFASLMTKANQTSQVVLSLLNDSMK